MIQSNQYDDPTDPATTPEAPATEPTPTPEMPATEPTPEANPEQEEQEAM